MEWSRWKGRGEIVTASLGFERTDKRRKFSARRKEDSEINFSHILGLSRVPTAISAGTKT